MFNLNIPPTSLLSIESSGLCSTPKTPEIVNSLFAMTNPMDSYNFPAVNLQAATSNINNSASSCNFNEMHNAQPISQENSHSSCSVSPLNSPINTNTTPSVQQTCSQLIKAGLKISIQSKRKLSTCDSSSGSEQSNTKRRRDEELEESTDDDSENKSTVKGLTPEDEDRRRRRRERNKIAATKCRMKKRERTQNLIKESEQLDTQNVELKNQVRNLERERRKLLEMLQSHSSNCVHHDGFNLPSKLLQSPAVKFSNELKLDDICIAKDNSSVVSILNEAQAQQQQQRADEMNQQSPQHTAIPPISTMKLSRRNGYKTSGSAPAVNMKEQIYQLRSQTPIIQRKLPNGYCKPSPISQNLEYVSSPSQDVIPLSNMQNTRHISQNASGHQEATVANQQLSEYIPNCAAPSPGESNEMLSTVSNSLTVLSSSTAATEFVKNEMVDSQSPYTTAQSAERFLFENNGDNYVDIKHAVSVHPGNHNNNVVGLTHSNILDFHSPLISNSASVMPFHDHISIKNDFLSETDLLAQLTGDAGELVDLDTGVAAAFITNSGCLA